MLILRYHSFTSFYKVEVMQCFRTPSKFKTTPVEVILIICSFYYILKLEPLKFCYYESEGPSSNCRTTAATNFSISN